MGRVRRILTDEERQSLPGVEQVERVLDAFFDYRHYRMSVNVQLGMVFVEYEDFLPCTIVRSLLAPLLAPYSLQLSRIYTDEALAGQLFALCELRRYRIQREDGSMGRFDVIRRELYDSLKDVSLEKSGNALLMQLMSERTRKEAV